MTTSHMLVLCALVFPDSKTLNGIALRRSPEVTHFCSDRVGHTRNTI
jgi:hypothetical protein